MEVKICVLPSLFLKQTRFLHSNAAQLITKVLEFPPQGKTCNTKELLSIKMTVIFKHTSSVFNRNFKSNTGAFLRHLHYNQKDLV